MQYSITRVQREISASGIEFDKGSVYDRLGKLTDVRKAKGKQYNLETLLMIILMAKLCGENTPMEIADWAKHRQDDLIGPFAANVLYLQGEGWDVPDIDWQYVCDLYTRP